MRRVLVEAAIERKTVTYGQLMKRFSLSRGHGRGKTVVGALDEIDSAERAAGAPGFAALVVRKDTGYPGHGFFAGRRKESGGGDGGSRLTLEEKDYANREKEKIWGYYRRRETGRE